MPKARNSKVNEALALYRQGLKLIEIARKLDIPEGTVRRWKCTYKWDSERSEPEKPNARKRGGQPGSRNRAAPKGNKRAEKFGFYSKYLPEETMEIFGEIQDADPLDLLWDQIRFSYTAILRAQRIAYVKDAEDKTEIIYEPWHWRYVGVENAAKINASGLCFEDYIETLQSIAAEG